MRRLSAVLLSAVLLIAAPAGAVPAAVPAPASSPTDTIGAFDPATGLWHLRDEFGATTSFYFGDPGDVPFVGDWDCDGIDTPGLYRRSTGLAYLRNSNTAGPSQFTFIFGDPDDLPLAGDFDGDGCDTVSVYRPSESRVYVHNVPGGGSAQFSFTFGNPGDVPFVGDFDGDGIDEIGLHRPATGQVFLRHTLDAGPADVTFTYGDPADRILAGDWTGGGTDTVAIFRPGRGRFHLSHANRAGPAAEVIPYGAESWRPLAGHFGLGGAPNGKGVLVVRAVGDVNLSTSYLPNLARFGHDYAWSGLDGLFRDDDVTIVNLECAASNLGTAVPKTFQFRCDLAGLPVMKAAGVEVANLGNNHARDFGPEALVDSRAQLLTHGILPVGAGKDAAEAEAPAVLEVDGWKVAVVGFGGVVPSRDWIAGPGHPGMADGTSTARMTAAVRAADEVADLVFVTVHWGIERDLTPRAAEIARGRAMVEAGADAVFGHHPHRLQPLGFHWGRPLFWSLGNFVWSDHSPLGNITAVAEVVVQPDGMTFARLLPALIVDDGRVVLR